MTGVKDLLDEVAAEAVPYDVTNRALRIARRQRRIALAAPVVAVLLVAAGAVAVLPRHGGSTEVSWLPKELAATGPARALPDGPVGLAALAYTRDDQSTTLVTEDGQSYDGGEAVRSISPDGRWVAVRRDGRLVLRDLTGTEAVDLGSDDDTRIAAWSPNGRWAAVLSGPRESGENQTAVVVDLRTGQPAVTTSAGRYGSMTVCGLRDNSFLVTCYNADSMTDVWVAVVNPADERDSRQETVSLSGRLFSGGQLMADGRTMVLWTDSFRPAEGGIASGDPMTLDLEQPGSEPRWHAIPDPGGGALRHGQSSVDKDLIVTRLVPAGQGHHVSAVELFDLSTGRLSEVTSVSGDIRDVVVRGQV